jgi:hypothetical protein
MIDEGILERVNHSLWATPLVVVDEHSLPTMKELFANMVGGRQFSKIDLSAADLE